MRFSPPGGVQRNTEKLMGEKFTTKLTDAEINPHKNYTIKLLNLVFAVLLWAL